MAADHVQVRALKPGDTIMLPQVVVGVYPSTEGDPNVVWLKTASGIFMQTNPNNTVHRVKKA